jgi:hypothetical protein
MVEFSTRADRASSIWAPPPRQAVLPEITELSRRDCSSWVKTPPPAPRWVVPTVLPVTVARVSVRKAFGLVEPLAL